MNSPDSDAAGAFGSKVPKTIIRIRRTITLIDEIPFTRVYYSEVFAAGADPNAAVESELARPLSDKLEDFEMLLGNTAEDKVNFVETIEVVTYE